MGSLDAIARVVHVVLLALWVGGGALIMAIVAPDAFHVLSSREEAANLVAAVVAAFDLFGLFAGPGLLVSLLAGWLPMKTRIGLRTFLVLLATAGVVVSGRYLTPRMNDIRAQLGKPIDQVELGNPLLIEFGNLHLASTAIMGLHVFLALVLLIVAVVSSTPKRRGGIEIAL